MEDMDVCSANYVPLTPISFLERAAYVYGQRVSIVFGNTRYLWKETHERCIKLASAISQLGIASGDIVAAVAPNIPALYEQHFGVPMAALGGTNICLRDVTGTSILNSIFLHNVTLFGCPPTLLSKINAEALAADPQPLPHKVDVIVAGALPEPQIRAKLEELGFNIVCAYGMSEALGPVTSGIIKTSLHDKLLHFDEDARIKITQPNNGGSRRKRSYNHGKCNNLSRLFGI